MNFHAYGMCRTVKGTRGAFTCQRPPRLQRCGPGLLRSAAHSVRSAAQHCHWQGSQPSAQPLPQALLGRQLLQPLPRGHAGQRGSRAWPGAGERQEWRGQLPVAAQLRHEHACQADEGRAGAHRRVQRLLRRQQHRPLRIGRPPGRAQLCIDGLMSRTFPSLNLCCILNIDSLAENVPASIGGVVEFGMAWTQSGRSRQWMRGVLNTTVVLIIP